MVFDDISKNIIRKFQWPRGGNCKYASKPSVYRIARELNVHPKVVKSRLTELFDSGLIRGMKFYADDAFMLWKRYFMLTGKTKGVPKIIYDHFQELPFVERVIFGTLYVPDSVNSSSALTVENEFSSISVIALNDEDLKKKIKTIEGFFGGGLNIVEVLRDAPKEVRLLNGVDLTIVNAMLYQDPLTMSINNMAQKLGIPARTLRRRVEKLLEDGVVYEEVSLDTNKSRGVMITSVIMKGDLHHWLPAISKSEFLSDRLLLYKNFSRFSFFIFYTETFSVIDDLTAEVTRIDPSSLVTYRNGSYNNPYVNYPMFIDRSGEK
jgi:DNA-binding Lrp family transcriptional regulator